MRYRVPDGEVYYEADVLQLRRELREAGYDVPPLDVQQAWQEVSSDVCAGWLGTGWGGIQEERVRLLLTKLTPEDGQLRTHDEW
jgi:hypothetical protein